MLAEIVLTSCTIHLKGKNLKDLELLHQASCLFLLLFTVFKGVVDTYVLPNTKRILYSSHNFKRSKQNIKCLSTIA